MKVAGSGEASTQATVELVERLGERSLVYARLKDGSAITAEDSGTTAVRTGDVVGLRIDGTAAHLFGPDGTGHHRPAA